MINGSTDLFLRIFLDPEMLFRRVSNPCGTTAPPGAVLPHLTHELTSARYYRFLARYYRPGRRSKKLLPLQARYYRATPAQYYRSWCGCNFCIRTTARYYRRCILSSFSVQISCLFVSFGFGLGICIDPSCFSFMFLCFVSNWWLWFPCSSLQSQP